MTEATPPAATPAIPPARIELRPATLAELGAALADTAADAPAVLVRGAGTAASWGAAPAPPDAVLHTGGLTGVIRYNPTDMTVAARAGTPLTDLQRALAEKGQRVAVDPARAARGATLGGLLATADAGPLQQSHGTLRDLVIGTTLVLADGTAASSGGHVIKNVAGYDLGRLSAGSLGTLGVLAHVVLRVHPLPRAAATVRVPAGCADAVDLGGRLLTAGLEPAALEWRDDHLLARFEGDGQAVEARLKAVAGLAGTDATPHWGEDADALWRAVDGTALGADGDTVLRVGVLPTDGPAVVDTVREAAGRRGIGAHVAGSVGVGAYHVRLAGGESEDHRAVLEALRAAHPAASVTVRRRDGLPEGTDVWGPPPSAVAVLRAVKERFDPAGRLGAGTFAPWL